MTKKVTMQLILKFQKSFPYFASKRGDMNHTTKYLHYRFYHQKLKISFDENIVHSRTQRCLYDDRNLLKFKTLHELQTNASIAFADNPLFGKYIKNEGEDPKFEYMSYSEYGDSVDTCRALLTNLGKLQTSYVCFSIFVQSLY